MDKFIERLKTEFSSEDARYAYADSITNAFITGQIKELREARNLTQEQLAELVGTKQSGISRWQNTGYSGCRVETLRKFARAFGVRLRISFEEFGSLPTDIGGFTKERLTPRKFEDDPVFKAPSKQEQSAAAAMAKSILKHLAKIEKYQDYSAWASRMQLAQDVMNLANQFPILGTLKQLAMARPIVAGSIDSGPIVQRPQTSPIASKDDAYNGLRLVPKSQAIAGAMNPSDATENPTDEVAA